MGPFSLVRFKSGTSTLFTQEDYDRIKAANLRMRKRLEDIQTARLTTSLAGLSVRPRGNTNETPKQSTDQMRLSSDASRLLSSSNPSSTTFIQPPNRPRVQMLYVFRCRWVRRLQSADPELVVLFATAIRRIPFRSRTLPMLPIFKLDKRELRVYRPRVLIGRRAIDRLNPTSGPTCQSKTLCQTTRLSI
jgi:hypothetical protein